MSFNFKILLVSKRIQTIEVYRYKEKKLKVIFMPKIRTESQCFIGICKEDPPVVIKQMDINWKSQSLGEVLSILLETIWSTYVKVAFPTPISPSYLETCFQQSRNNLEDVAFSKAF